MRRGALLFGMALALGVAGLLAAWLLRFRVAGTLLERRIAEAGVPASYRITRIGPFRERIEDVRIGDPRSPDLVARRIDVLIGYAPRPFVRGVRAEHVRIVGRIGPSGLSLGALDRLLPGNGSARAALPDLDLALRDAALTLATPNGTLVASLEGSGNPQRLFRGRAVVGGAALRIASCRLTGARGELQVEARSGAPGADGRVDVARSVCPGMELGGGAIRLRLSSDTALRHVSGGAVLSGFPGELATARFAGIAGPVQGAGELGSLDLDGRLTFASASAPDTVRAAVKRIPPLAGTPFAPTAALARDAVLRLLGRADADVTAVLRIRGEGVRANVRRLELTGDDGARLVAVEHDGLSWSEAGPRLDADISAGGALPPLTLHLRQAAPGAPLTGAGSLAAYRAGSASLAIPAFRFASAGRRTTFEASLAVDGPLGDGMVRALRLAVRGWADADGAFAIGDGCGTIAAGLLKVGSISLADVRLPVCGRPLLARSAGGTMRVAATTGPIMLHGRTAGDAPLSIAAASGELSERGFAARDLAVTLGGPETPTRLAAASLAGTFGAGEPHGIFGGASARIGAVPLALADGKGRWRFTKGVLGLEGELQVSDTADPPRFRPLLATGAMLALDGGAIRASALLREPAGRAEVAKVDLAHDLATGAGHASLTVDALRFAPKGLQPDALTPATLGVIANVAGVVTGRGRIDWTARGVASSGSFGTDRLDLAAAFGPATGIAGTITFTDLLGLVSAPHQTITVAEINPGVAIADGVVRFSLPGSERITVENARWPFAHGTLRLEPTTLDLASDAERRLTFRVEGLDAGAFVQQLELPNVSATGTFDGVLPMIFGQSGGRIAGGSIAARPPGGTLAYVGELTSARLGTMGKLAFDALKAIRYSTLAIDLDGQLDGEMVSRVGFTGVREATPDRTLVTRLISNLPFRFNITIRAPFRGLVGTARSYMDPQLLLGRATPAPPPVQPLASAAVP